MADYVKGTNFAIKDGYTSGNPDKIIKGAEIDAEFTQIATKMATKSNTADPTFTGTVTIPTLSVSGTATIGTIDGGTY